MNVTVDSCAIRIVASNQYARMVNPNVVYNLVALGKFVLLIKEEVSVIPVEVRVAYVVQDLRVPVHLHVKVAHASNHLLLHAVGKGNCAVMAINAMAHLHVKVAHASNLLLLHAVEKGNRAAMAINAMAHLHVKVAHVNNHLLLHAVGKGNCAAMAINAMAHLHVKVAHVNNHLLLHAVGKGNCAVLVNAIPSGSSAIVQTFAKHADLPEKNAADITTSAMWLAHV